MAKSLKKRFVVSAVNFTEGGPLTALRDCLSAADSVLSDNWEIVALVHDSRLFDIPRVRFIEFPRSKFSWSSRLFHEFWRFHALSLELKPDVWLSLHDISPRVSVLRQVVYCHNPAPFYKPRLADLWWEPRFLLFTLFYRYLYRFNIHANDLVVVQQDWIRQEFKRMFNVKNVLVAHPVLVHQTAQKSGDSVKKPGVFLYPALPRVFKNFEVLCEAARLVRQQVGDIFEVRLTLNGDESKYAAYIKSHYGDIPAVKFIGRQNSQQMALQYQEADVVVFPSRLETWGLPISEAQAFGKPIIVSDLPYAHESVGNYARAVFFNPLDSKQLAAIMLAYLQGELKFNPHSQPVISSPFAPNWESLIRAVVAETVKEGSL